MRTEQSKGSKSGKISLAQAAKIPLGRKAIIEDTVTVWQSAVDVDRDFVPVDGHSFDGYRIVIIGDDFLHFDSTFSVSLDRGRKSVGTCGAIVGVFDGPSRQSTRSFDEWSKLAWQIKNRTSNSLELATRIDTRNITLSFEAHGDAEVELRRVHIEGTGKSIDQGKENISIPFRDHYSYDYGDMHFPGEGTLRSPTQFLVERTWVLNYSKISTLHRREEGTVTGIGPVLDTPASFKDLRLPIPDGTYVQVNDHPGIEFEWQDGEIVRTIDRKTVDSLSHFQFTGAKWFLPTVVLLVAGIGGIWWWVKRRNI